MNIESLWSWLMTLCGLSLTSLGINVPTPAPAAQLHHKPVVTVTQTPKAVKPTATPTPAATPAGPIATATPAAPAPTSAPSEMASEQTCPGQSDASKTAAVLTCLTAQARLFHGLTAVTANAQLMTAAAAKDQDMLSCGYGHEACGKAFNADMTAAGYAGKCTAENIASGQPTPGAVFQAWMQSPGHRANILNGDYRDIGVAEVASSSGPMWVMELGGCQ